MMVALNFSEKMMSLKLSKNQKIQMKAQDNEKDFSLL